MEDQNGVFVPWSSSAPSLASLFASSFPMTFVWALAFITVMLCDDVIDNALS